ncbi:hypothetical protein NU08_0985 [Flavobacterium anhuiense]|uniref:Uncharacterized protein n=1 Tax=Flavobacterium anhuiense TaxID=459526 RepID=A0A444W2S6_9FLAO|nr:hypothetical protein NU08_0985 [Flavobacterium anhuiense]
MFEVEIFLFFSLKNKKLKRKAGNHVSKKANCIAPEHLKIKCY